MKLPSRWILLLAVLPLMAAVALRLLDPLGDRGLTNVATYALVLLSLGVLLLWFVLGSGLSARYRLGIPAALALVLAAISPFVTLEGWSGSLVPHLRWGAAPERDLAVAPAGDPGEVDLTRTSPTDWPGFLGPRRQPRADVRVHANWEARPPELLWRAEVGSGWSAFALVNGVAITQEQRDGAQAVTAYDLETGELLWIHTWGEAFDRTLAGPGPRATPTVAGGRVFALGPRGSLRALDGRDGSLLWSRDLLAEYGMTPETEEELVRYGRANSPLVHAGRVVIPAGGDPDVRQAGLVAYDADDGELVWEGPPRQLSFASPSLRTLCGHPQILIVNEDTVSGHDPEDGSLLWEHPWPGVTGANASCSQPRVVPGDRVFVSKGYGVGAAVLQLTDTGEGIEVEELWHSFRAMRTKFTNVAFFGGTVVGLSDGILECVDLEDGSRLWRNGRYGHGQILAVGARVLVLSEDGELLLIDPAPEAGGEVLARRKVLEGKCWNNLALSGDLLAVRSDREAAVWRLPLADS